MSITRDPLLTRPQAAEILGLQTQTLAKWSMTAKNLPVVRLGGRVRYKLSDVEQFVERSTVPAGQ